MSDHDTPALRQRMTTLWAEQQNRATQLEAEAYELAEKWKTQQAAIRAVRAKAATEAPPPRRFPPANETYFEPAAEPEYALAGQTPPPDETTYDPGEEPG